MPFYCGLAACPERSRGELQSLPASGSPPIPLLTMPRILLAEDGPTAMGLVGALFENPDLDLDVVTDGRSVLERVSAAPSAYSLVVLSYDLPEISGPECAAFLRRMLPQLPIFMLLETIDEARLSELAQLGIGRARILKSPADPETFAAWINSALAETPPRRRRA